VYTPSKLNDHLNVAIDMAAIHLHSNLIIIILHSEYNPEKEDPEVIPIKGPPT